MLAESGMRDTVGRVTLRTSKAVFCSMTSLPRDLNVRLYSCGAGAELDGALGSAVLVGPLLCCCAGSAYEHRGIRMAPGLAPSLQEAAS